MRIVLGVLIVVSLVEIFLGSIQPFSASGAEAKFKCLERVPEDAHEGLL